MDKSEVTVRFSRGVRFKQVLSYAGVYNPATVTKVNVTGEIGKYDFQEILSEMGKTLQELNLSGAYFNEDDHLWCFYESPSLISIDFPAFTPRIESDMFGRWSSLNRIGVHPENKRYSSENGILFNKDKTVIIKYPTARKGEYVISGKVREIDDYAFYRCKGLTSISIPDSVVRLGRYAFAETGLTSVVIPQSVTAIERHAFYKCTELSSIDMPETLKYKKNRVFEDCEKLPIVIEEKKDEIRQGKIDQLQKTSAIDWVEQLMKNSKYAYKIDDGHKTRFQLKVLITDKQKLEIRIPFRHFQTVIPKLMDTIQQYEACMTENDVTVYIDDIAYDKDYWQTKHLPEKEREKLRKIFGKRYD